MQKRTIPWVKWLMMLVLLVSGATAATVTAPTTTAHAATVYVTRTGKHYFYNRHDRGLNRAKKVFAVSLATAKSRGLTLSATESAPKKKPAAKKPARKPAAKRPAAKKPAKKPVTVKPSGTYTSSAATYHVQTLNRNNPGFSKATLSTKHGAWQRYGNLDGLNRATAANALLNRKLMPKAQRQPLYVIPA